MRRRAAGAVASILLFLFVVGAGDPADADAVDGGTASAFAVAADIAGNVLIPPTPESTVDAPPFGDDSNTSIPIDADPLLVNGTLIATAKVHEASDIASALEQPSSQQSVEGPYNAQGVGQIEDLEVLVDAVDDDVPLLEADLLRGEAVAVCTAGTVSYSASSEVVNLVIGGEDPLSGPLNDLVTQISEALNASPLVDLVDIDVNVVTATADGASVDALVVTVLPVVDPESPLIEIRLGHAEVAGTGCGTGAAPPECSDTADNDDDGVIDAEDPGCHSDGDADNPDSYDPNDDDESDDGGAPECSDTADNDGDGVIDAEDPGCHSDGDADNPDSYDPNDDDESDDGGAPECSDAADNDGDGVIDAEDPGCHSDGNADNPDSYDPNDTDEDDTVVQGSVTLPQTGAAVPTGIAVGLLGALGAAEALRRRARV